MSNVYIVISSLTSFLFFNSTFSQTTYISIGSGDYSNCLTWSPSCPPSLVPVGDSVVINHRVTLTSDLYIYGSVSINSTGELNGTQSVTNHTGGTLYNFGKLDIGQDLNNDGSFFNDDFAFADKIINNGYICNTDTIEISPEKQFLNSGGTIDCGGTIITCKFKTQNSGSGIIAHVSNTNFCCSDGSAPSWIHSSGIVDLATVSLCGVILPVQLVNFGLNNNEKGVLLNWETKTEINNDYFVILRSLNGIDFEKIGKLNGMGNSSESINYEFFDERPLIGTSYYKLQQVDFDGKVDYSSTLIANFESSNTCYLYPNPSKSATSLFIKIDSPATLTIDVYNVLGSLVFTHNQNVQIGSNSIPLRIEELNEGMYFCVMTPSKGKQSKMTFVKVQ